MKKVGKSIKVYFIGMVIGGITLGLTTVVADTIINSTNVSYKTSTVKAALDDLYGLTADDVWQKIYPIGSIYISVSNTNPATLFGGTWEAFGEGRTLIGVGTGTDENSTSKTFVVNSSGGLYEHTHGKYGEINGNMGVPIGHAMNQSNTFGFVAGSNGGTEWYVDAANYPPATVGAFYNLNGLKFTTEQRLHKFMGVLGESAKGESLPPYITVYMWKRTA